MWMRMLLAVGLMALPAAAGPEPQGAAVRLRNGTGAVLSLSPQAERPEPRTFLLGFKRQAQSPSPQALVLDLTTEAMPTFLLGPDEELTLEPGPDPGPGWADLEPLPPATAEAPARPRNPVPAKRRPSGPCLALRVTLPGAGGRELELGRLRYLGASGKPKLLHFPDLDGLLVPQLSLADGVHTLTLKPRPQKPACCVIL